MKTFELLCGLSRTAQRFRFAAASELPNNTNVAQYVAALPFRGSAHAYSLFWCLVKGGFFQKVQFVFQISKFPKKDIPKNYPELEI